MRIIFLVSSLRSGGAERVAAELTNAWVMRSNEVELIPTFSGGGSSEYLLDERVKLKYLVTDVSRASSAGKMYFARLFSLRGLIKRSKPDVVVSFLPNVNVAAILSTAFLGVPCIISERTDPSIAPLPLHWRLACRWLYRFADTVIVQTQAVSDSIQRLYPGLRDVKAIPNPVAKGLADLSKRPTVPGARRTLLCLGRLVSEKNVNRIIDAFATLAKEHPDWDLHIYGDGPRRAALQAQVVSAGLSERVLFFGQTLEPWRVMAESDAFVMASQREGFPNALLEAMAIGLPCVTTDCPSGPREISAEGKFALLVPPNDPDALAQAIGKLMANPTLRQNLGDSARLSVNQRYALTGVLSMWDDAFVALGLKP